MWGTSTTTQEDRISGDISCCCRFPSCLECRDNLSKQPLQEEDKQVHVTRSQFTAISRLSRGIWMLAGFGIIFLVASYAMFALRPIDYIVSNKLSFVKGSTLYNLWTKPPVDIYIKVFAFNITNPQEFISGKENMKVEEIGPYIYKEILENTNITFNTNDTVTYTPRRTVRYEPTMSKRDPHADYIYTPNVALLGMASMLHNSSTFLNLGLATLARYLDSQPFVNISVHEMLWGYDEPLVRLGKAFLPSWIFFSRLGLLDRMFDEGLNVVTMTLKNPQNSSADEIGRIKTIYTFENWNGRSTLKEWDGASCNSLNGVSEGILYPKHLSPNKSFVVYRKAFCRLLSMQYSDNGVTKDGFPVFWFRFPDNLFDSPDKNPENSCYCHPEVSPCLLSGLADITPCYYSIPLALSRPHFYKGDPRLFDMVEGLNPNSNIHESVIAIQPDLGLPMSGYFRMQLNLVVHNTRLNPRAARFNNRTLPIFWIDWYFEMSNVLYWLFYIVLFVCPILQTALTILFAVLGTILLGLAACSCSRKNTAVATKILNKSQHLLEKNTGEQLLVRAQKVHIVSKRQYVLDKSAAENLFSRATNKDHIVIR